MKAAVAAVGLALGVAGCAEMVRWPDRMTEPAPRRAEPAPEGHYVVKPGDTMYSIAFRHQLDFRELAVWNDVGPDWLIRPGQVIRLSPPPIGTGSAATSSIATTPMERGDPAPAYTPAPDPPPMAASQWRWPVTGPVVERFSEDGKGIDIGGKAGQPVVAAAAGKVVYSGAALKGYGELIIVKHDDVHLSAYGYNRRRLVAEGAQVAAGQAIAELGVGPEQKPALHFEIRRKGKPVDPMQYLPPP